MHQLRNLLLLAALGFTAKASFANPADSKFQPQYCTPDAVTLTQTTNKTTVTLNQHAICVAPPQTASEIKKFKSLAQINPQDFFVESTFFLGKVPELRSPTDEGYFSYNTEGPLFQKVGASYQVHKRTPVVFYARTDKPTTFNFNGVVVASDPVLEDKFFAHADLGNLHSGRAAIAAEVFESPTSKASVPIRISGKHVDVNFGRLSYVYGNSWELGSPNNPRNQLLGARQNLWYTPRVNISTQAKVDFAGHVYGSMIVSGGKQFYRDGFVTAGLVLGKDSKVELRDRFLTTFVGAYLSQVDLASRVLGTVFSENSQLTLEPTAWIRKLELSQDNKLVFKFDPSLLVRNLSTCSRQDLAKLEQSSSYPNGPDVKIAYKDLRRQSKLCPTTPFVGEISVADEYSVPVVPGLGKGMQIYVEVPQGQEWSFDLGLLVDGTADDGGKNKAHPKSQVLYPDVSELVVRGGGTLVVQGKASKTSSVVVKVEQGKAKLAAYRVELGPKQAFSPTLNQRVGWEQE